MLGQGFISSFAMFPVGKEMEHFPDMGYNHFMKSVRIHSFSGPHFLAFGLNTEIYSVFSLNAGKYGREKLRIRTIFTQ